VGEKTFEVTESTFQQDVLQSDLPVLIDFWAEWCAPCRMIAPLVDQLAEKYEGKLRVGKLDADQNQNILINYGVMGIPTLMLFNGGEVAERIIGFMPMNMLEPNLAAFGLRLVYSPTNEPLSRRRFFCGTLSAKWNSSMNQR
jgi:thioredoxin 1